MNDSKKDRIMFKRENSAISIRDGKLYVISPKYKDFSPRAIMIVPGFQVELGRDINDLIEAIKYTRLPVVIKFVIEKNGLSRYSIIRLGTGKVENKVVATIVCNNNIIVGVSFNKELLNDDNYKKYNRLTMFHLISLPHDLVESSVKSRGEQVYKLFKAILNIDCSLEVKEDTNRLIVILNDEGFKSKFNFILVKDRFNLMSITADCKREE